MEDAWIETYTGLKFNPFNPKPEDVDIRDIAHGLSNICRYNGQCKFFFSVAQHSLNAAGMAKRRGFSTRIQLLCLLHDAAESYISDVSTPIKFHIPQFEQLEKNIMPVIYNSFAIEHPTPEESAIIKEIDAIMLSTEARELMHCNGWGDWIKKNPVDGSTIIIDIPIRQVEKSFITEARFLLTLADCKKIST